MSDSHTLVVKLKELQDRLDKVPTRDEYILSGVSDWAIRKAGGYKAILSLAGLQDTPPPIPRVEGPKILILDIELSPMVLLGFGLRDQNFSLDQVLEDWYVMSWAAKWFNSPASEVMYADVLDTPKDDSGICSQIWQLMDEADIIVGQNSKGFDDKKLSDRFYYHKMPPPSSYRHLDTYLISKSRFSPTSHKLAYRTERHNLVYKKLDHNDYPGFKLWRECLNMQDGKYSNLAAWASMKEYCIHDVLSTEEYFAGLIPWIRPAVNINVFHEGLDNKCLCGSRDFRIHDRDKFTNTGRFTRFICQGCGAEYLDKTNLLGKDKREALRTFVN